MNQSRLVDFYNSSAQIRPRLSNADEQNEDEQEDNELASSETQANDSERSCLTYSPSYSRDRVACPQSHVRV